MSVPLSTLLQERLYGTQMPQTALLTRSCRCKGRSTIQFNEVTASYQFSLSVLHSLNSMLVQPTELQNSCETWSWQVQG